MKIQLRHLLPALCLLAAADARAATWSYYLRAGTAEIPTGQYNGFPALNPVPNENVLLWGYAQCTDATFSTCGPVQVPGPVLVASEGDTLDVSLQNGLAAPAALPSMISEPTSLIIPGQPANLTPVWVSVTATGGVSGVASTGQRAGGDGASRVRSFTAETAIGAVTHYTFSGLRPGTYLYQSGTHPAVQLQMGLYGALKVYPAATPAVPGAALPARGQAYGDPSTAFDSDVTLVFSEIDPELHYSIASGRYGTAPPALPAPTLPGQRTSTVSYRPKFFLINGQPSPTLQPIAKAGQVGKTTLLRLLNAGLKEKTPTLVNQYLSVIAEDGSPYSYVSQGTAFPAPRQQYGVLLPAGKTLDALLAPATSGNLAVFDRSLNLTNAALPGGGQLAYLAIADAPLAPASAAGVSVGGGKGAFLKPGAILPLTWRFSRKPLVDPGPVRIELLRGGRVVKTLARAVPADRGVFHWFVPRSLPPASDYTVRISGKDLALTSGPLRLARPAPRPFSVPF